MATMLRIIEGPEKGTAFPVGTGDTIIGRGAKAQAKLASPDVSWEHALVTRVGEEWMIENLSAHGTLVNDGKISGRVRLRARDRIRVGDDTVLRFETTEGPQASLLANPWVMRGTIGAVALLVLAVVASMVFSKPAQTMDWPGAHAYLLKWVNAEVEAKRMPPEVAFYFISARRKEVSATSEPEVTDRTTQLFKSAALDYQKVQLYIDAMEEQYHCMALAADKPRALWDTLLLLKPGETPSPNADQTAAAFEQFVRTKLDFCNSKAGLAK